MDNINDLLNYNLDQFNLLSDYGSALKNSQQIKNYTNKFTMGNPNQQYTTGIDKRFIKSEFESGNFNTTSFQGVTQYRSLKQFQYSSLSNWNPDVSVFTPEGIGTLEYSPWSKNPLTNPPNTRDRISRVSYTYSSREYPLRGPSGTSYAPVDYFRSAFWVNVAKTDGSTNTNALDIIIPKSFFIECNFYDVYQRPEDVSVYTSSGLNIDYSGLQFTSINPTYYNALTQIPFTISVYDSNNYSIRIDPASATPQSTTYASYLICAGSNYVPTNTNSSATAAPSGSFDYKISALRYIDDIYSQCVKFPKSYDKFVIRSILTSNITLSGLQGMSRGDLVILSGQNNSEDNGLYIVDSGPWFKISDYVKNNFLFCTPQSFAFTGSSLISSHDGRVFNAPDPDMKILSFFSENVNPSWLVESQPEGNTIASLSFSGSLWEDFKFDVYNYNITEQNSVGVANINLDRDEISLQSDQSYFIPSSSSAGRLSNSNNIAKGSIIHATCALSGVSSGQIIFLYESPSNFAIAEVLFINNAGTIVQLIIRDCSSVLSVSDLIVYNSGTITGKFQSNSNFTHLLEPYQRQILLSLPLLNNLSPNVLDISSPTIRALISEHDLSIEDIRALAVNPFLYQLSSVEKGHDTDYKQFNSFELFGFLKSASTNGLEGAKISPQINHLVDDEEHHKFLLEYLRQISQSKNSHIFVDNSIADQHLANQEFDFNSLSPDSISGELSTSYTAIAPYHTGPNLITSETTFADRVAIQDSYGNPYFISEKLNTNIAQDIDFSSLLLEKNEMSLGATPKMSYEELWSAFTGPYSNGLALSKSLYVHAGLSNPLKNVPSSLTKAQIYKYQYSTGSQSDLIFNGNTLFIPISSTNYTLPLKACEIYAKTLGEIANNGFLRAAIVDLSRFYETNNATDIKALAVSNKTSITYLTNNSYKPIRFSFTEDAHFNDRLRFGQNIFLAIEKFGDFRPGTILIRCANQADSQLYQTISGSNIMSNLRYSSALSTHTGSSIYNLYQYLGNPTVMNTSVEAINTLSIPYIRYPYINNVQNKSYNSDMDRINIVLSGSAMGGTLTTGPGNISLNSALGIGSYSFDMFYQFTGPIKQLIWGVPENGISQSPKGYHVLIASSKTSPDGLPDALMGLERDFVFNTLSIPETTLYFADTKLIGVEEGSNQDLAFISAAKDSIINQYNPISSKAHQSALRKSSLITPVMAFTGPVVMGGILYDKTVDFIFKKAVNQIYHRSRIDNTPGMAAVVYQGDANGIPSDFKDLSYISMSYPANSAINSTQFTGPNVLHTNMVINFKAPQGYEGIRITSPSGSVMKIQNITTQNHTGPWNGPNIYLSEKLHTGSFYSILATIYGTPSNSHGVIEYYDGTYRRFNILSGSLFPSVTKFAFVEHPDNTPLLDTKFTDSYNVDDLKFFTKRFSR